MEGLTGRIQEVLRVETWKGVGIGAKSKTTSTLSSGERLKLESQQGLVETRIPGPRLRNLLHLFEKSCQSLKVTMRPQIQVET